MINSKMGKLAATIVPLMLLVAASGSLVNKASALPANALWTDPSTVTLNVTTTPIGYKFNVTVWVNLTVSSFTWQAKLLFNSTYFNATRAGYTARGTSQFFSGHITIPVTPVINNVGGTVLHGESLSGTDSRAAGSGSLMWAEFVLKAMPPTNHFYVNISTDSDTFFLDPSLNSVSISTTTGTKIPVLPEFPQLIVLFIAISASTASALLTKKLKR